MIMNIPGDIPDIDDEFISPAKGITFASNTSALEQLSLLNQRKSTSNLTMCFNGDPFKNERKLLQNEIFELKRKLIQAESRQSTELIILTNKLEMMKKETEEWREKISENRDSHEKDIKDIQSSMSREQEAHQKEVKQI